jgi:hypothetical protein
MAGVTSTIAAGTALAGMGMSIGQAVNQQRLAKQASSAAAKAAQAMRNIKEQNMFSEIQVPTLGFELAQQGIDRSAMSALNTAQGAGVEGVIGSIGQIQQATSNAQLELASQADQSKFDRDKLEATAGQGIEQRRAEREQDILDSELTGAQEARTAALNARNKAITSAVGSFTTAGNIAGRGVDLYRKQKKANVDPNLNSGSTGQQVDMSGLGSQQFDWNPIMSNMPTNPNI